MRRQRHEQQYPRVDSAAVTAADAEDMIGFATEAVAAAWQIRESGQLTPWR
jgi:hypothetical protein